MSPAYTIITDPDSYHVLINGWQYSWNVYLTIKVYPPGTFPTEGESTVCTFMSLPDNWHEVVETCFRHYVEHRERDDR